MNFNYLVESGVQNFKDLKVTKKTMEQIIRGLFKDISDCLANGQDVSVRGFGRFKVIDKKARVYIEPRNQTPINKPAVKYPKFAPSDKLKDAVNS